MKKQGKKEEKEEKEVIKLPKLIMKEQKKPITLFNKQNQQYGRQITLPVKLITLKYY